LDLELKLITGIKVRSIKKDVCKKWVVNAEIKARKIVSIILPKELTNILIFPAFLKN
jgi:hypothetical protein